MKIFLLVIFILVTPRIFFYRKFRIWLATRRRKNSYKNLIYKLRFLRRFKLRKNKEIPFFGYFGAPIDVSKKVYVITSLAHGLEDIPAHIHSELLKCFNEGVLIKDNISIISVPILNHWGFKNGARTTKNGVDLLRNSPYISKHSKRRILLSGWNSKLLWLFARMVGFSYYFKGFRVHGILKELYKELLPILKSDKEIIFIDLHTGNNKAQTTLWTHELSRGVSVRIREICEQQKVHLENVPYATDGGIIEYFVQKFPQSKINGYTIEFDVLEKEGMLHYLGQVLWGDVFAAPVKLRHQKIKAGLFQLAALMEIKITWYLPKSPD